MQILFGKQGWMHQGPVEVLDPQQTYAFHIKNNNFLLAIYSKYKLGPQQIKTKALIPT